MTTVDRWTGREANLLRQALRLSVRDFAARLGVVSAVGDFLERARGVLAA